MALAYLTGSVTQGSADAFAIAEVATALAGATGQSFRVREIIFQYASGLSVNGSNIQLALSRRSKTAFPLVTDRDVIALSYKQYILATSGATVQQLIERFTYTEDDDVRIVEDPLYLMIDSATTSASSVAYVRIGYERANISAVDRLTLLTQSLES